MFVRYTKVWVTDVMYSDCFEFEAMAIAKEVGGVWNFSNGSGPQKQYGIEFEVKSRCHILKPFKFEWVMHSQFEKEAQKSSE